MTDFFFFYYLYFKAGCLIPSAITNCLIFCLFHKWVKRVSALMLLLCVSSVDFLFIVLLLPVLVPDLPDSFLSSIVNHFSCVLHRRLDSIHPDINKTRFFSSLPFTRGHSSTGAYRTSERPKSLPVASLSHKTGFVLRFVKYITECLKERNMKIVLLQPSKRGELSCFEYQHSKS